MFTIVSILSWRFVQFRKRKQSKELVVLDVVQMESATGFILVLLLTVFNHRQPQKFCEAA